MLSLVLMISRGLQRVTLMKPPNKAAQKSRHLSSFFGEFFVSKILLDYFCIYLKCYQFAITSLTTDLLDKLDRNQIDQSILEHSFYSFNPMNVFKKIDLAIQKTVKKSKKQTNGDSQAIINQMRQSEHVVWKLKSFETRNNNYVCVFQLPNGFQEQCYVEKIHGQIWNGEIYKVYGITKIKLYQGKDLLVAEKMTLKDK